MAKSENINPETSRFNEVPGADQLFELGMMYSTGRSVPTDMVSAHKWFNIAAMQGVKDAVRLRHEIAAEMSEAEIAAAQRAAREWLKRRH
jgi:TPR repeat protein